MTEQFSEHILQMLQLGRSTLKNNPLLIEETGANVGRIFSDPSWPQGSNLKLHFIFYCDNMMMYFRKEIL